MSKQVNKKYEEFWTNKEFDVKSNDIDNDENKKAKKKPTMARKKAEAVIKEEVIITQVVDKQPIVNYKPNPTPVVKTLKEIYEQYDIDGKPYKIYLRGQVIFDSASHKDRPLFFEDHFILFGNKYIYKGIRFEKY